MLFNISLALPKKSPSSSSPSSSASPWLSESFTVEDRDAEREEDAGEAKMVKPEKAIDSQRFTVLNNAL